MPVCPGKDESSCCFCSRAMCWSGKQTRPGYTAHGLHPHQLSNDLGCQHDLVHSDSGVPSPLACVPRHELLCFLARWARLLCCWCPDLDVMLNACTTNHNIWDTYINKSIDRNAVVIYRVLTGFCPFLPFPWPFLDGM